MNSIEAFDLTGSGDNSITLKLLDLRDLTNFNWLNASTAAELGFSNGTYIIPTKVSRRQLLIDGDSGDNLTITEGDWLHQGTISNSSKASTFSIMLEEVMTKLSSPAILTLGQPPQTSLSPPTPLALLPVMSH